MLYAVEGLRDCDSKILYQNIEVLEHCSLQVEGICCVIAHYGKYAEMVASLAKNIRNNLYQYLDEMVFMGTKSRWGIERFNNDKVCKLFLGMEDDIRDLQKIVAEEENEVVDRITKEMEVTVADAMALNGLRKCIEISENMVVSLFSLMHVTNRYVNLFESEVTEDD